MKASGFLVIGENALQFYNIWFFCNDRQSTMTHNFDIFETDRMSACRNNRFISRAHITEKLKAVKKIHNLYKFDKYFFMLFSLQKIASNLVSSYIRSKINI